MDVKDFDYDLPEELIAQDPLEDRSSSRLMVLDKNTGEVSHHVFKANQIINYFDSNPKSGSLFTLLPMLFTYFQNLMIAY